MNEDRRLVCSILSTPLLFAWRVYFGIASWNGRPYLPVPMRLTYSSPQRCLCSSQLIGSARCFLTHTLWNNAARIFLSLVFRSFQEPHQSAFWNSLSQSGPRRRKQVSIYENRPCHSLSLGYARSSGLLLINANCDCDQCPNASRRIPCPMTTSED
jgi:hypothetical protein